jgi:outer membrane protein assembly factor BamB
MLYFIDFETGKPSRDAIDVGNPIKGSVSLDPTLNGNLYVGQGVPFKRPFGHMVVDLHKGAISKLVPEDNKAKRRWGAFDSSPLRVDRFLFWPGENGTLYKYTCAEGDLIPHSTMRYTRNGTAPGMEASISVYRNYGYTADNHGNIVCTNLNTMQPVWCFDNGDDTDATIVVCEEDGSPFVYIGNEVDRKPAGPAYFRKLNALTGKLIWELSSPGRRADIGEKHFDGGYYASPLPGKGNCSELIFSNCVANLKGQNGDFVAINRKTGEVAYRVKLALYAWSSPVGFLNENDEMFIFTGDTQGNVYLINGIDGKVLCQKKVGNNFESSPVVIGNQVVVGSRGNSIYKMTIK